ncbi:MAG: WecB/TagA/CpsF family glycosyltransferase [Roseburia sp.]|nr:WecB/TagA/CpsF family glycosyltransferase [Roseburia sp.]
MKNNLKAEIKTCNILGTDIAVTNMNETIARLEQGIEELRGQYICVSNVHTTVMAYENKDYWQVQHDAAFCLPDGKPLSVYSRKHGFPEAERVTGPDLMGEMFARDNGLRHYFYGGTPETIATLQSVLRQQYPHIRIAGMVSPPFRPLSEAEDAAEVEKMNDSGADIIWVGLGAPKQEKWMYEHKGKVNAVMIGVGAGFDYHTGTIRRAPMWMQKASLEWLYRLMQDPKRLFSRYLKTNLKYLWLIRK